MILHIFDEIDINGLPKYQTFKMINKKNQMVHYLKDMEWKLIKMLSTPIVVRKINNEKFQLKRLWKKKEQMVSEDRRHVEAILESFKELREGYEYQVKSDPEKTIPERVELNPRKEKNKGTGLNQTSSLVSTNKTWKKLIKTKKRNQTNTVYFVSA